MKERLRSVAEATGLLDVRNLRRRVALMEDGLAEHVELQQLLQGEVEKLEDIVRSILEQRS
ncbi:MAG TPA: hypothetical protein VFK52_12645 [Nocardioidaceae bacterium]|nr:hypothetical protein [Nocardioidaceae bacterium]